MDHNWKIEKAEDLARLISLQPEMMADLEAVAALGLPQGCIAAGYIRNFVWDQLHGYETRTPYHDVDVVYYDATYIEENIEKEYEAALIAQIPQHKWSVKNQARMHLKNGNKPFHSVEDAMLHWPETATAVGVRLNTNGELELLAPFGLEDLLGLVIRQSPYFNDHSIFLQRMIDKEWLRIWPKLLVIFENSSN